jgi:hypothetical protein
MFEIGKVLLAPALWVALLLLAGAATRGDAPAAQSDRCESPAAIASTVGPGR